MLVAHPHIDLARGSRLPSGKLLTIGDGLIQDVYGATPDVEVLKVRLAPSGLREQVMGTETSTGIGHVVVELDSMINSKGPKRSISDIWPVDRRMKKHRPSDRHDSLDASLGHTIVVVCTHTCKARDLRECFQVLTVGGGSEGGPVITKVL